MPRHCYVLRVFTRGDEGGNHLGVVTDATGLTTDSMQAIAVELGFSETIFLEWEERKLPRVRIFTPGGELPFAGHPLVGMAWTLKQLGPGGPDTVRCAAFDVAISLIGDEAAIDVPLDQPVRPAPHAAAVAAARGASGSRFGTLGGHAAALSAARGSVAGRRRFSDSGCRGDLCEARGRHGLPLRIRVRKRGPGAILCAGPRCLRGSGDGECGGGAGRGPAC